jgi:serine/threonine-protein kinase HipA
MSYEAPIPFYDAAPDGWGKAILRAAFPAQDFGLAEFLAASGNDRTGDLAFGHSADEPPIRWLPSTVPMLRLPNAEDTIEDLLEASEAVEGGEPKPHHLHLLFWHSADQGGARPKATVFLGDRPYMAKFPALGDPFDDPRVEGVCLSLGAASGIKVPPHHVRTIGGRSVLFVQRFDRTQDGSRLGYMSAGTLLQADPNSYHTSYTYFDVARRAQLAGIQPCGRELFQRLLFNCFVHNTDDHLRNHGFVRSDGGQWTISPLFDVSVHRPARLVLAPASDISPEANPIVAFQAHERFRLSRQEAEEIYDGIVEGLRQLPTILDQFEITSKDRSILAEFWTHAVNPPALPPADPTSNLRHRPLGGRPSPTD